MNKETGNAGETESPQVSYAQYQEVSNVSLPNNSKDSKTPPVKVPSPPAEESPPVELCFSSAEQGCYKRIPSEAPTSAPSTAEPLPTWL